jgi:hypothetical protein
MPLLGDGVLHTFFDYEELVLVSSTCMAPCPLYCLHTNAAHAALNSQLRCVLLPCVAQTHFGHSLYIKLNIYHMVLLHERLTCLDLFADTRRLLDAGGRPTPRDI